MCIRDRAPSVVIVAGRPPQEFLGLGPDFVGRRPILALPQQRLAVATGTERVVLRLHRGDQFGHAGAFGACGIQWRALLGGRDHERIPVQRQSGRPDQGVQTLSLIHI